ncbi:MAG TPA: phosphoenolpyruvate--protein phosphotransferase [Stellaceae bacterium]|nr:phosphoenolpyruvate--protein phosphotransferase [Stellaceae bacterium]
MDHRPATTGSRRLLSRLRDVMAGPGTAQQRLDKVVRIIAGDMVAEVCSVYLLRAGDILELCATEGLAPEAVHHTRLRLGEGLVGVIGATARPLALSDAQAHPSFAYRPETGEEIYHSLMGVPILRQGKVSGVLVVQNQAPRHYTDDEVEALETIAMVLAELVASGGLVSPDELHPVGGIATLPHRLDGVRFNPGLAIGTAVLHEPDIVVTKLIAEDPAKERQRLETALAEMHVALDRLLRSDVLGDSGEHREILETYRLFAEDRGWLGRMHEAISSGLTAEAAVQKVREDTAARMSKVMDPYIRERMADLEDLAMRLLRHLSGEAGRPVRGRAELPADIVLLARNMGPAELLDYDRRCLRALVLEEGSANAHVTIVARALDIPVVGRVASLFADVVAGDQVAVDADNAQIFVRPSEDMQQAVERALADRSSRQEQYRILKALPAVTLDGVAVRLMINAGLLLDLPALDETGADGIGLYRTELPFMARATFPSVEEQAELYRRVLDQAGDRTVVFRTLDIGGDKLLPYLPGAKEENPAMGWRAIRIALDRPSMLRHQLRALILAADGRPLDVMFPMVATVTELAAARRIFDLELERTAARRRTLPSRLRVGTMIEVPALVWHLGPLCRKVDFLSVGSNDLMQFLFAKDRGNPRVADRYDDLAPAALNCLDTIVRAAAMAGTPLSICGEMAGGPIEAMALIGLGFRTLSMTPSAIGPVKSMVRRLELAPLARYIAERLNDPVASLRDALAEFARDHGIAV